MSAVERSRPVQDALEGWVASLSGGEDAGVIGDWMAIVCMTAVDGEGRPRANYYLAMRDGSLLPHVAHGLLMQAQEEIEVSQGGEG